MAKTGPQMAHLFQPGATLFPGKPSLAISLDGDT